MTKGRRGKRDKRKAASNEKPAPPAGAAATTPTQGRSKRKAPPPDSVRKVHKEIQRTNKPPAPSNAAASTQGGRGKRKAPPSASGNDNSKPVPQKKVQGTVVGTKPAPSRVAMVAPRPPYAAPLWTAPPLQPVFPPLLAPAPPVLPVLQPQPQQQQQSFYYRDLNHKVHGPFSGQQLEAWWMAGQCNGELPVSRSSAKGFRPLRTVLRQPMPAWNALLKLLKAYKKGHHSTVIPVDYVTKKGEQLGQWVETLRESVLSEKRGQGPSLLSANQKTQLEDLGFEWDIVSLYTLQKAAGTARPWGPGKKSKPAASEKKGPKNKSAPASASEKKPKTNAAWSIWVHLLKDYQKQNNGSTRVPKGYETTDKKYKLGKWVKSQRALMSLKKRGRKGHNSLSDERIAQLEALGFEWVLRDKDAELDWDGWLDLLREYKALNRGSVLVPAGFETSQGFKLGEWVAGQRSLMSKKKKGQDGHEALTDERIAQLEAVGFEWDPSAAAKPASKEPRPVKAKPAPPSAAVKQSSKQRRPVKAKPTPPSLQQYARLPAPNSVPAPLMAQQQQVGWPATGMAQSELSYLCVAPAWYYWDRQNMVRGPYPPQQVMQWLHMGQCTGDLLISRQPSGPFYRLSQAFPTATGSAWSAARPTWPAMQQTTAARPTGPAMRQTLGLSSPTAARPSKKQKVATDVSKKASSPKKTGVTLKKPPPKPETEASKKAASPRKTAATLKKPPPQPPVTAPARSSSRRTAKRAAASASLETEKPRPKRSKASASTKKPTPRSSPRRSSRRSAMI